MKVHQILSEADKPRMLRSGPGWKVIFPDGTEVAATSQDAAANLMKQWDVDNAPRPTLRAEPRASSNPGGRIEPTLNLPGDNAPNTPELRLDPDEVRTPDAPKADAPKAPKPFKTVLGDLLKSARTKLPMFLAKLKLGGGTVLVGGIMDAIEASESLNEYVRMGTEAEAKYAPRAGKGAGWNHPDVKAKREQVVDSLLTAILTAIASIVTVPVAGALATAGTAAAATGLGFGPPGWIIGGAAWLVGMGVGYLATRAAISSAVEHMEEIGVGAYIQEYLYDVLDEDVLVGFSYADDAVGAAIDVGKTLFDVESVQEAAEGGDIAATLNARMTSLIKSDDKMLATFNKGRKIAKQAKEKSAKSE